MQPTAKKEIVSFKKKKKVWTRVLTVLLVLLPLPAVLAGVLYIYMNLADFQYDDPEQVISRNTPMSFSERNSFDAFNCTRTMLLDNPDMYYLTADLMPDLHFNESIFIKSYRIALEDEAIYFKGQAYGINIPIKLGIEVAWKDGSILIRARYIHIGKLNIPIPVRLISKKFNIRLEYTLPVQDNPLFKPAIDTYLEDGYLKIVYPVDKSLVSEGISGWIYLRPASFYQIEEDEMVRLIDDYQKHWTEDDYISNELETFIKEFQQNPETYQDLKVRMLAAAPVDISEKYFAAAEKSNGLMSRFYPGISAQAVENMRGQLHYEKNYLFLKHFVFNIDEKFGSRAISIRKGSFVDHKTGMAIDLNSLYENSPEFKEVFPEGTKYCAIYCEGADSKQKIGKGFYSCGTAVQFANGRCAVMCKKKNNLYFTEITPQEYENLASGKTSGFVAEIIDR